MLPLWAVDVFSCLSVDTDQGLIVPVIRMCERLTAPAITDFASLARSHRFTPDDARGGTFTISNPGSFDAYSAMGIINQPTWRSSGRR